ncbi:hypothetical protein [Kitasatospora cheerisanensis]|uniref:Uncharacterized protein n=1 Tax=Kitasatospora cheerisanensis KCTC 2395 TaxID=1348663 RepID=A0A066YKK8_9ACTN|nr:hypothetical protein [Kitasatospora cheerisanensis]KDN80474.1 hypothetical protein KCH_77620 [Kitasatospora cheerisanensis KCTC 2395]
MRYSAVHGPGCDAEWFYADPIFQAGGGGLNGSTCHGQAVAATVSGVAGHADGGAFWQFNTGHTGSGSCTIDVYVPNSADAGGTAIYFLDARQNAEPPLYSPPPVNQVASRGQWASLGTWPIPSDGWFSVTLSNKPARSGDAYKVAASASRATCRW